MKTTKTQLAVGVAGLALAAGMHSPAQAACTVDGTNVTCSTDSTAAEVNAALAAAGGTNVTLTIADDVDVVQPNGQITPNQQGAVSITTGGNIGTETARVNVVYFGTSTATDNTVALANSGAIEGGVGIFSAGGDTSIDNSGTISNGITVSTSGTGDVSLSSTGDIDADGANGVQVFTRGAVDVTIAGNVGTPATDTDASDLKNILVSSQQSLTPAATSTVVVDGTTTTTTTTSAPGSVDRFGSAVSVTLEEGAASGQIGATGLDGATIVVDGSVGSSTQYLGVNANSSVFEQDRTTVSTVDGADFAFSDTNVRTAVGGEAVIAIGETGSVSGNVNANGLGGASVDVAGTVGSETATASAFANSSNSDRTTVSTGSLDGTLSTSTYSDEFAQVGGIAQVSVAEGGVVTGGVSASGVGGAQVSIDGTVGLEDAASFGNANSNASGNTFAQQSTFDSATGESTFAQQSSNFNVGGDASLEVGADGVLYGSASASANGDASVNNAGYIEGGVNAAAFGTSNTYVEQSTNDGMGSTAFASESTSTTTGGAASITNAAGGLIGESATSPAFVSASGDTAGSIDNAGRVNGSVSAEASGETSTNSNANSFTSDTDAATGVVTTVSNFANSNSRENLGGAASFDNAAGGLVTGSVTVRGQGSAAVTNEGAVIGTTYADSQFTDTASEQAGETTTVSVPGVDGGTTVTGVSAESYAEATSGGDVTGVYAGTNGAVQFAPFGGASDGSVTQEADGDSSAVVSGTIFGNFTGNARGYEFNRAYAEQSETVIDADGDLRSIVDSYDYAETNRQSDSDSALAVNGGKITGNASVFATGSASVQLGNGAEVGGSVTATAQGFGGYDYAEQRARTFAYDEDGVFTGSESDFSRSYAEVVNQGDASVAIGDASVAGSVNVNGAGGTNTFTLAADGAVGGSVFQTSAPTLYSYEETRLTTTTPTSTVQTFDYAETRTAEGGEVSASVAGTIGLSGGDILEYGDVASAGGTNLALFTNDGNASATVTGQIRGGISVSASGQDTSYAYQEERVNGARTAYAEQRSSTATGGTASLVVNASDLEEPANFGNIFVAGRAGSSVTIGANSSVLAATNGASMQVGSYYANTTSTRTDTFDGTVLTDQALTSSTTVVGGPATLTNNGRIGYDGGAGFGGDDAFVGVTSATAATATNNGDLYGSIAVSSLYENVASTTTRADITDVTRVDTTDRTYAAGGGTATLVNGGLITGDASVAAITGRVTNNGVLRGDLDLGASVDNYTTRSTDTLTQIGEEEVLDLATAIEQGYAVEQNGLLGGTISVGGAFGQIDDTVRTSNITAAINLNSGSVTGGGVAAEYDEETGERFTRTTVNLNGAGYLGLGDAAIDALGDRFGAIDPRIDLDGDLSAYAGGARVLGVDALNKTGSGVFLITGADFGAVSNTNRFADYTLDIGTFTIAGGEIQLDTASDDGVFGIRGNVVNNAGLVLGSRVTLPAPLFGTNATVGAIDGTEVYQQGNFTQSGSGTLTVGIVPTLVRVSDPAFSSLSFSTSPLAVQQVGLASGLFTTPQNAFGQAFTDLGTGFLTLDGNLNLGGTVQLVSPTGGLFTDGQRVDIASVSGTVSATANVSINGRSNFVDFDLATRSEGGRTIVFVSADRVGFDTAATNQNAAAAGGALSAALPGVVSALQAGTAGGIGLNGNQFSLAQDLANIFVAFDTLLTQDEVGRALNELASGEFYGSLTNISTTAPFVDAISSPRIPEGATGFNVWFAPSGKFADWEGNDAVGSFDVDTSNYGATMGFGVATGSGEIGLGFGYGRIEADSRADLLRATADTWMAGAYARQAFGPVAVGAELVYGWSKWDANRVMPLMSREATAEFDSSELRGTLHAEYNLDFGGGWVAPFGRLEYRNVNFDGFTEVGAGAVNLIVEETKDSILSPSLGLRAGTKFDAGMATLRPELTLSYTFQGDTESYRDVAFAGSPTNSFRLQGILPDDYLTIGAGLFAGIGSNSGAFLRGGYVTGKNVKAASVNAGITIGF